MLVIIHEKFYPTSRTKTLAHKISTVQLEEEISKTSEPQKGCTRKNQNVYSDTRWNVVVRSRYGTYDYIVRARFQHWDR